jgi:hypothetical protein
MPPESRSVLESATVTKSLPSKLSPLPCLPVTRFAPRIVPELPLVDAS